MWVSYLHIGVPIKTCLHELKMRRKSRISREQKRINANDLKLSFSSKGASWWTRHDGSPRFTRTCGKFVESIWYDFRSCYPKDLLSVTLTWEIIAYVRQIWQLYFTIPIYPCIHHPYLVNMRMMVGAQQREPRVPLCPHCAQGLLKVYLANHVKLKM